MRRVGAATVVALALGVVLPGAVARAQEIVADCDFPGGRDACSHWYTTPWVSLSWDWTGGGLVVQGCATEVFNADSPLRWRSCKVSWGPSTEITKSAWVGVDRTAPAVSAAPARAPDHNGWFNHPVSVAFTGADATSGIHSCTSAGYAGPDTAGVVLPGSCRDVAGNVGQGSFALNYDATPPSAPDVTAVPNNHRVKLSWPWPADAELVELARLTADGGQALLHRGAGRTFTDGKLRNGLRHRYLVTAIDRAGNRSVDRASAVPTSLPLLVPPRGARIEDPPLLRWEEVKRASYYNVQIYRGRRKVLTRWPRGEQLQLGVRLRPGRYHWFVFPGFGERSARRYGRVLGESSFTVVKPSRR